jgi:hypothetical protein
MISNKGTATVLKTAASISVSELRETLERLARDYPPPPILVRCCGEYYELDRTALEAVAGPLPRSLLFRDFDK